jgi:hypothetical protein
MDREKLETATADATYLRGLLALPLGVVFLATGLGNLQWGPFEHAWVFVGCIAAAGGGWLLVRSYYNATYGHVTAESGPRIRAALPYALYGAALVGGPLLDRWVESSVSLFAALFAAAALSWYALRVQLRPHHLAVWGGLLVAAFLPLWDSFDDRTSVAFLAVGVAVALSGVFDHWTLVRRFRAVAPLDDVGHHRASA